MARLYALPALQCHAKANRSGERCKRYATPGAVTCRTHGSANGRTKRAALVRLGIAELLDADPRPLRVVLADAVRIGDAVMRELDSAVTHGQTDAASIGRLIESARYAATLAKIALDSGVTDPEPEAELVPMADAAAAMAQALRVVVPGVIDGMRSMAVLSLTEGERAYADALAAWAFEAASAVIADRVRPPLPERPSPNCPPQTGPSEPSGYPNTGASPNRQRGARWAPAIGQAADVIDAEVVDDVEVERLTAEVAELRRLVPNG